MPVAKKRRSRAWRSILTIIIFFAVAFIIFQNLPSLTTSLHTVRHASLIGALLASLLVFVTYCIAAAIYQLLAVHTLRYGRTVVVEIASAAANRILPAGVGGLGLFGVYLYKHKHTPSQATAVIAINNLLGIVAHTLLFVGVSLAVPSVWQTFSKRLNVQIGWAPFAGLVIVAGLLLIPSIRRKIHSFFMNILGSLRIYARQPQKVVVSLLLAMLMTITFTAILYITTRSLHISLSPLHCFVVFSIGMLAATATPTPGGLVGAEAGLFAGFSAYGLSAPNALAATLLFRLVAYWLPVIPGIGALLFSRHKRWL